MKFNGNVAVLEKEWLADDVFKIIVQRHESMGQIIAGQFFNIKASPYGYPMLNRPISVSDFSETTIEFTIKVLGDGTKQLSAYEVGDVIEMMGPLGNGFSVTPAKKILLVGGGIGIAPLKKLCYLPEFANTEIHVVLGFRDKPYFLEAFKEKAVHFEVVSEREAGYRNGFVTEPLKELLDSHNYDMVFSCGPQKMLENVAKILVEKEVKGQVLMEEKMACGIGACLVCTCKIKDEEKGFKHKRMCKDGPMFFADEVIFDA